MASVDVSERNSINVETFAIDRRRLASIIELKFAPWIIYMQK